jgi:hypothetical protein
MIHFSYKDIDFKDIEQVSATIQYWLYKIERLNRNGQMSIEFAHQSASDWQKMGLGRMREQILEEVIDVLNSALNLDLQKIEQPYSLKKRKFYVPIKQLMAEGATDIFTSYPNWQAHLNELGSVILKIHNVDIYDKQDDILTKKLVALLSDFNIYCHELTSRQAA